MRFWTTEAVDVEGAMLEETVAPLLRAMMARQCCIRLAKAMEEMSHQPKVSQYPFSNTGGNED